MKIFNRVSSIFVGVVLSSSFMYGCGSQFFMEAQAQEELKGAMIIIPQLQRRLTVDAHDAGLRVAAIVAAEKKKESKPKVSDQKQKAICVIN